MFIRLLRGLAPAGMLSTGLTILTIFIMAILPTIINQTKMKKEQIEKKNFNNFKILIKAMELYGCQAIRGNSHNNEIVKMLRELDPKVADDDTPWCSAFLYRVVKDIGIDVNVTLAARSWLKVGTEVLIPKMGDIAIFWRKDKNSWQGHAAIFIREGVSHITILGGNQNNMVQISLYSKIQLLGYRRFMDENDSVAERTKKIKKMYPTHEKGAKLSKRKTKTHGAH